MLWAIPLVGSSNDGVVGADLEHVLTSLGWAAVDGEGVVFSIDRPPLSKLGLVRGLNLPVLDEVLHQIRERALFVAGLLF